MAVVGVRSSLFLPFSVLGLVIVDEEQEPSYKQQDPAPRYHARNAAIMLASYVLKARENTTQLEAFVLGQDIGEENKKSKVKRK